LEANSSLILSLIKFEALGYIWALYNLSLFDVEHEHQEGHFTSKESCNLKHTLSNYYF
jgi:hypothetical protein